MKGVRCRLARLGDNEVKSLEAQFGPTDRLPKGPEGKVTQPSTPVPDFMRDEDFGDGVEFEAVELSLYGRSSL